MWKVKIQDPSGNIFIGSGAEMASAYADANAQYEASLLPTRGPGLWELKENPNKTS